MESHNQPSQELPQPVPANTSKDTRVRAIGWFLTYPQCPLTKEEALEQLHATGKIKEHVIAAEKHEDGNGHLHCFIKYETKATLTPTKFDLRSNDGTIYHGNYQVAKSWAAVEKYCKKDGDFIASFNTADAKAKKAKVNIEVLAMTTREAILEGAISFT